MLLILKFWVFVICLFFLFYKVKKEVGDVSIVVNNVGVIYLVDLFSIMDEEIIKIFEVNVLGYFWVSVS